MSTTKLNEADLLQMGFTRANIAALRQAIDALGNISDGSTLADVLDQIGLTPSDMGPALQSALSNLQQSTEIELALSHMQATITELRKEVEDLKQAQDDAPAQVVELAKAMTDLLNELTTLPDPSAQVAEAIKTLALKANIASPAFTTSIGFNGSAAIAKQTVTGARGGNAALASLLTAMATVGLITDSTTA